MTIIQALNTVTYQKMKTAIIFTLILSLVGLVLSHAIGRSINDNHPTDNLLDSDLSKSKSPRIVNEPTTALAQTGNKSLDMTNNAAITTIFLPTITFLVTFLVKSKLTIIHLLFGIIFGIVGTIATCHSTPLCSISAGPSMISMEPMVEYLTPDNIGSLVGYMDTAIQTYEAVRKLS